MTRTPAPAPAQATRLSLETVLVALIALPCLVVMETVFLAYLLGLIPV